MGLNQIIFLYKIKLKASSNSAIIEQEEDGIIFHRMYVIGFIINLP